MIKAFSCFAARRAWLRTGLTALVALLAGALQLHARAAEPVVATSPVVASDTPLDLQLQQIVRRSGGLPAGVSRVEVQVGQLDPRLKLAPCRKVEPHLPPGARLWGKTRVGLRCSDGPVAWNVYLPVTVKVYAAALVSAAPLAIGHELVAADLQRAEVDIAAGGATTLDAASLLGRTLQRALAEGEAISADALRARQWFAAGETVTLLAVGAGFSVSGEGEALGPGLEGQNVRVRTEGGRIVTGTAVAPRRVELRL